MTPLLRVESLSYQYPDGTPALNGVSFSMQTGQSVALLGPNGSGKTTLLLHLTGLLSANRGQIEIDGARLSRHNRELVRRTVGIVFQEADDQLFMSSVLDDCMFGPLNLGMHPDEARRLAADTLSLVGIGPALHGRPPFHLSAGEKKRVALAGVLAMRPKLLVLDEPTTSLDPPGQRSLLAILRALPQTILVATHDVRFAESVAQRALFLQNGELASDDALETVVARHHWRL